jgi:hypothetical protein
MKTTFFFIGAGIDIIALLIAAGFMIGDALKGRHATNNPTMFLLVLGMAALIGAAFWLKHLGKLDAANALLWLPGIPLGGYVLMVLLFIILKPDMR